VYYPALADIIVYYQPPTLNGTLYASQNDVGGFGNFAARYDDSVIFPQVPFVLTDVHWCGGHFNPPTRGYHGMDHFNLRPCRHEPRCDAVDRALSE